MLNLRSALGRKIAKFGVQILIDLAKLRKDKGLVVSECSTQVASHASRPQSLTIWKWSECMLIISKLHTLFSSYVYTA